MREIEDSTISIAEQVELARKAILDDGMIVIRKAFDPVQIGPLLAAAKRHAEAVVQAIEEGTGWDFPSYYRWVAAGFACELGALDPNTAADGSDDFNKTTLCAALMTPLIQEILRKAIGEDAGYAWIRARVVLPKNETNGSIGLHKEKTAVRFPGLRVLWTPLTPPDIVTNVDAPGIEFRTADGGFSRPTLRAGDVAIFTGEIDHGTHIPETAAHWRVGCDIRAFPWTAENLLPDPVIAMGDGPRRLVWPSTQ